MPHDEPFNSSDANPSDRLAKEMVRKISSRWASWARALLERHTHIISSTRAATMAYVRAVRPVELHKHELHKHLIRLSLGFYPRINLAIRPILRELDSRHTEVFNPPLPGTLTEQVTALEHSRDSSRCSNESSAERALKHPSAASILDSAISARGATLPSDEIVPRGLPLVFKRLRRLDEFARARGRTETLHRSADRLALRLVEQSRRIEQRVAGSSAVVARQTPPDRSRTAQTSITTELAAQAAPAMFRAQFGHWPNQPSQMSDAVVEQLTERVIRQIDQRVIAHRERMGKI